MKQHLKIKGLILGLLLAATTIPISSTSAQTSTSCSSYIRGMFEGFPGDKYGVGNWFNVKATRITARGYGGFSSFAMAENYSTREGISTTAAGNKEGFTIKKTSTGASVIQGKFQDVFPGRKDGKSDLTTLNVHRDGRVQIVLNAWGNNTVNLSNLVCYRGHQGSTFVLTGNARTASHGFDAWTFVITPNWLI
ncbi:MULTISPECIES: hypothetical protein [Calothrix]|uniref:Uncharacterized protein n=2 Tax=Calothrix TaxID=1186 RepID=A0ABR8A2I4_9CYAN|nr:MULTISPECIES: hypothetical protein [Calothrix]MBD2194118.1 hypothetical protein [Calothrix parietina FACHB-288]MBD2227525.1 hypothetical protein [Calothrix anomala FACHB-343]